MKSTYEKHSRVSWVESYDVMAFFKTPSCLLSTSIEIYWQSYPEFRDMECVKTLFIESKYAPKMGNFSHVVE